MRKFGLFLISVFFILIVPYAVSAEFSNYQMSYSDITAYINHHPVPSFACDGKSVIKAEDLEHFGFDVVFDSASMTLDITRNSEVFIDGMRFTKIGYPNGFPKGTGTASGVKVRVNGYDVDSFAYDGCSMIAFEDLGMLGDVYWVPEFRALKLWADGIHIIDYAPLVLEKPPIDPDIPMIALTFDDGPSYFTDDILDVLEKYGAKATFFIVGERAEEYSSQLKRACKLGMEIGNHTYSHVDLTGVSWNYGVSQITGTDSAVLNVTGSKTTLLRPPGGFVNSTVCSFAGKPIVMWSVDTLDWKYRDAWHVASSALAAGDGDIVLMHDLYPSTAKAVKTIVPQFIERGYQLVTISELAYFKGYKLSPGIVVGRI